MHFLGMLVAESPAQARACWSVLGNALKEERNLRVCGVAAKTIEKMVIAAPALAAEGIEYLWRVLFGRS